jgi:Calcineurin-like phosphoesterase
MDRFKLLMIIQLLSLNILFKCLPTGVHAFETPDIFAMASSSQSSVMNGNNGKRPFRLGYVTDVEGNLDYFVRYVEQSRVLKIQHYDQQSLRLDLCQHQDQDQGQDEDCYFVYGGDAVDKGPGDIRLVRALVDLKKRYPDRVYLLVGNRDLNKLRFVAELAEDDMSRPIAEILPPHWDPQAPSLWQYLQTKLEQEQQQHEQRDTTCGSQESNTSTTSTTLSLQQLNTRVNRLHYMLEHTLGCPNTFHFRRQELALLQNVPETSISDDHVVQSFLEEVQHPHGSLWQYLDYANVAVVLGNTLFCHGAVDSQTMQFVPRQDTKFENPTSKPAPSAMIHDVHEWTRALNDYLMVGLEDHKKRPLWNSARTSRGGEALLALQNRPAMWGRSIVSNAYGDGGCITTDHAAAQGRRVLLADTNHPLVFEKVCSDPLDTTVADWLLHHGIQRVMVGHKPTGDCPAVLSATYTGVEIVSADTSFSDTSSSSSYDTRGQAMAVVELVGASPMDNQLELRGCLRNGQTYVSRYLRLHPGGIDTSMGDANLGRAIAWLPSSSDHDDDDDDTQQQQKWWVKVAIDDDKSYWLTRGRGRHVQYKQIAKDSLVAESKVY